MVGKAGCISTPLRKCYHGEERIGMNKNGFTLLEIIIVLFLITVIVSLSSVFFAGFLPSARVDAAGREIAGLIRYARSLARMNMETRIVVIDLDNGTYGIDGLEAKHLPPDASAGQLVYCTLTRSAKQDAT